MRPLIITHRANYNAFITKSMAGGNGTFVEALFTALNKKMAFDIITFQNILASYALRIGDNPVIHDIDGVPKLRLSGKQWDKFAFTIHSPDYFLVDDWNVYQNADRSLKARVWWAVSKASIKEKIRRSAMIVAVSSNIRQFLIDNKDVERDRIRVINHGISKKYGYHPIAHENFVVGTLNNMCPQKNPLFLINAFKMFRDSLPNKEKPDVKLRLYGGLYSEKVRAFLQAKISEYNSRQKKTSIELMGPLTPSEKLIMYNSIDAFCYPSFEEGFGIPILEAQASGLPVIINGNGIIADEVQKHCLKAFTDEQCADMLKKLYEHGYPKGVRSISTKYAQSFTWEKAAAMHISMYEDIERKN